MLGSRRSARLHTQLEHVVGLSGFVEEVNKRGAV